MYWVDTRYQGDCPYGLTTGRFCQRHLTCGGYIRRERGICRRRCNTRAARGFSRCYAGRRRACYANRKHRYSLTTK